MSLFDVAAILFTLSAVLSWLNHRYLRLPTTIGVMLIAICVSASILALGKVGVGIEPWAEQLLATVDFDDTLLQGMLSYLLFAGALHINLNDLREQRFVIATLATFGVVASTFIVGTLMWLVLDKLELGVPYIYALLFGALISPTDPIAVLGILKTTGAPKSLETKIAGESLFNDGVGVVVFLVLLDIASGAGVTPGSVALLFAHEAVGGAAFGFAIGIVTYWMLRRVDNYHVEVLLTLALVTGGYALAMKLHVSGPIAMVVAGLLIGNQGRALAMSDSTREHLDTFWELVDEVLNAVLFVLIGLELVIVDYTQPLAVASVAAIGISLTARFTVVGIPIAAFRKLRDFSPNAVKVMTWGGLRGGISIALALSLPESRERDILLGVTYGVVVFSIAVQGLTVRYLVAPTTDSQPASGH